jgi:hypothetical protein
MPEQKTLSRARADKRAGKAPSTQAGEFVKEEVDRVRAGKHGVRSAKQAIAIGLSKARRAGVDLKAPAKGTASEATRKKAAKDNAAGQHKPTAASTESKTKRSRASTEALKRESSAGASKKALSAQAKSAASRRPASSRSAAAKKAAATKGASGRSAAAKKAAHTRAARAHH